LWSEWYFTHEFYTHETHIIGTCIGEATIEQFRKRWKNVGTMKYEFYQQQEKPEKKMKVEYLAEAIFTDLIADTEKVMGKFIEVSQSVSTPYHMNIAQQRIFIYLVASNAIVLTNDCPNEQIEKVIKIFKKKALDMIFERWQMPLEKSSELVQLAADDLMKLLYTDPKINEALSFEWAKTWFSYVGIFETNPAILHEFSSIWKQHNINLTKYISSHTVVD
jgi:hypothetical protein